MKPLQIFVQTYRPAHWRDKASCIRAYSRQSGRQPYRDRRAHALRWPGAGCKAGTAKL